MKIETVLVNIILDIERTMKTKKYLRFYAALTVLKERIATFNDASLIAERVEQLKVLYTSPEYDQFVNELKETEEELRRLKRSARIVQKGMKRVHPTLVEAAETIVRFNSWCEKNIPVTGFLGKKHPLIQAQQEERAACLANNVKQLKKLFLQERERNLALIEMMRSVGFMHPTDPIYVAERRRQTDRKVLFAKIVKATQLLAAALLFSITGVGVYAVGKASNDETILKELAAYADDIRQTSQAEVAFEEQFGFDLYGNYTNEHVKVLATCLSDDAVAKLKAAGVTKIFLTDNITSEKDAEAGYTYAGMAHNNGELLGRRVRLDTRYLSRSTIDHEAAHIFHYHILEKHPEFDELWKKAAGKFAAYNSVGFEKGKGHFFLDNQNAQGAHHTFVKPYGGKNIWEDVATFVEVIKNTPREFLRVIQHQEAYEAKIQLLLKFNFITLEEAETALDFLYHR